MLSEYSVLGAPLQLNFAHNKPRRRIQSTAQAGTHVWCRCMPPQRIKDLLKRWQHLVNSPQLTIRRKVHHRLDGPSDYLT